jgi:adenosylcobinamide kinase/adenosylcobinamide-phosphate guanylyltransferase
MILITGGARVGKTKCAIDLCRKRDGPVLYVATQQLSEDFLAQEVIRRTRKQRPFNWVVTEAKGKLDELLETEGRKYATVLIENMPQMVSNLMRYFEFDPKEFNLRQLSTQISEETNHMLSAAKKINPLVIFVTHEVNPLPESADIHFRVLMDILGRVNQQIAVACADVYWVASGIPIKIK